MIIISTLLNVKHNMIEENEIEEEEKICIKKSNAIQWKQRMAASGFLSLHTLLCASV